MKKQNAATAPSPDAVLLSAGQVALLMGVSVRTIWRMVAEGTMPEPTFRKSRKLVRWQRATIEQWLAGNGCQAGN